MPMNVLFVCSRNRLRSPTAEQVFADYPGIEVASAGLRPDAEEQVTTELVQWADMIFVMEMQHKKLMTRRFARQLKNKKLICLRISDQYEFMDPNLIQLLQLRVGPFLPAHGL